MNDMKNIEKAADTNPEKVERGASLVEYALLVALIAVVCIVAIRVLGTTVSGKFSEITSGINS